MPRVSVLILNWNGKHLLEQSLPAILGQDVDDYEVVVFDNGSTDGSCAWIEEQFPRVRLMRSERNLGFAGGNNAAIRATGGEFVATLNNDAVPDRDWLATLLMAVERKPHVGMCASKMVRADNPTILDACGIEIDRAGIGWNRCSGELDPQEKGAPYEVFGACAGAALYRRAMLDEVGLFDEDYFAYYEDVDLAWRARRAGWRCLYVPTAWVEHHHSSTGQEGSPFKGYHLGRNKVWTAIKNYSWPAWLWYLPAIVGYDAAGWGYALMQGDVHPLRGRLAALKSLGPVLRKRRAIQATGQPPPLAPLKHPLKMAAKHRGVQRAQAE